MNELTIQVVGITSNNKEIIDNTTIRDLEINGGYSANICCRYEKALSFYQRTMLVHSGKFHLQFAS